MAAPTPIQDGQQEDSPVRIIMNFRRDDWYQDGPAKVCYDECLVKWKNSWRSTFAWEKGEFMLNCQFNCQKQAQYVRDAVRAQ